MTDGLPKVKSIAIKFSFNIKMLLSAYLIHRFFSVDEQNFDQFFVICLINGLILNAFCIIKKDSHL